MWRGSDQRPVLGQPNLALQYGDSGLVAVGTMAKLNVPGAEVVLPPGAAWPAVDRVLSNAPARGMTQFEEARRAICAAKRICFLGFGYDRVNIEHLLRGSPQPDFSDKCLCGSALDRTEVENRNVNQEFFVSEFSFGKSDWDASRFLRESGVLEKICHL